MTTLLLLLGAASAAWPAGETDPEPPPSGVLHVRLVAKKATYKLDLKGRTAEEYLQAAKKGEMPAVPVDLDLLVIRNETKGDYHFQRNDARPLLYLRLKGKGSLEGKPPRGPASRRSS